MSDEEIRATVMATATEAVQEDDEASRQSVFALVTRALDEVLAEPSNMPDPTGTYPPQADWESN